MEPEDHTMTSVQINLPGTGRLLRQVIGPVGDVRSKVVRQVEWARWT